MPAASRSKRVTIPTAGAAIGAASGFMYWSEIGCNELHCVIASQPLIATAYGALLMGLIAYQLTPKQQTTKKQ
jgi:hypothetical protein